MIVRRFLQWAQSAQAGQRADGVRALARAYLNGALCESERHDAEIALTAQLDDASPLVRRALAETLASAPQAPRHLIVALAHDQSDIAAIVLNRSPHLSDAELIDAAAIGDAFVQSAVALRPNISAGLAAALIEVGSREALICLAVNQGAMLTHSAMARMLERFASDGELREALLARPDLPASLRNELANATAIALSNFVTHCQWLSPERAERVTKDARERATLTIAASVSSEECLALVRQLRACGHLTAALILRALLCGHAGLFEAALADLAGLPLPRVIGLVRERRGAGFAALYRKAGLPIALLPAFRAVLAGIEDYGATVASADGAGLSQLLIERVLTACSHEGAETDKLYALLRRFEAEAAREVARAKAQDMMAQDMMVKDMLVMDLMAKDLPLVPSPASAPSFASPAEPEKTWASDPSFEPALSSLDFPPVADLPDAAPAWRSEREEAICINVAALPVTFRGEAWLDRAPAAAQDISLWIEPDAAARDEPQPEGSWVNDERSVLAMLDQDFLPRPEAAFVPSSKPVGDCGVASCRGRIDIDAAAFVFEPDAASPQALALIESIRVELGLAGPNEPGHDAELHIFFEELQFLTGSGSRPDSAAFAVAA